MTPQERAKQLFEDFLAIQNGGEKFGWNNEDAQRHRKKAKECALLCVRNDRTIISICRGRRFWRESVA